jgi:epoxyqueuosine reductase
MARVRGGQTGQGKVVRRYRSNTRAGSGASRGAWLVRKEHESGESSHWIFLLHRRAPPGHLELAPDTPFEADRCGTCTRCLDACPTGAFVEARLLDATRCISYLTIELRGEIPEDMRLPMGTHIYGCDICQDVCPYNVKFAQELREPAFAARAPIGERDAQSLARELVSMDDESFRTAFRNSPIKRAKRRGLARNAAVVLGNIGDGNDEAALTRSLGDDEPLVRRHASWALDQINARTSPPA